MGAVNTWFITGTTEHEILCAFFFRPVFEAPNLLVYSL